MKPRGILLFMLFILLSVQNSIGQQHAPSSSQNFGKIVKEDFNFFLGGFKHVALSPTQWDASNFRSLAIISGGTLLLTIIDEESNDFFTRQRSRAPQIIDDFGWYSGKPLNGYSFMAGTYALGLFTKNDKIRKTGVLMITSATISGLLQTVSKNVTGRARPQTNKGAYFLNLSVRRVVIIRFLLGIP